MENFNTKRVELGLWVVGVALGVVFLASGLGKLMSMPMAVELFDAFGLPRWAMLGVGWIEVTAAVLVMVPKVRFFGAFLICAVMLGAGLTHGITGVVLPMIFLNVALFVGAGWVLMKQGPRLPRFNPQDHHGGHPTGV